MPNRTNYLLGFGERLSEDIDIRLGGGPKSLPYTLNQAFERLTPMLRTTLERVDQLPAATCPLDETVTSLTLHPEFVAKSYFPTALLRYTGLRSIGSRSRMLKPERSTRGREPKEAQTTELFLAGARCSFHEFADMVSKRETPSSVSENLRMIENFSAIEARNREIGLEMKSDEVLALEVVLHASQSVEDRFVVRGFQDYLEELGLGFDEERVFYVGGLCFVRLRSEASHASEIANYSFVRVVRQMPALRVNNPLIETGPGNVRDTRPSELDPNLRVAVFDGGVRETSLLGHWATPIDPPNIGPPVESQLDHGEAVTSALLFGSIEEATIAPPPCRVDHHRVLDEASIQDRFELYDVLTRIQAALLSNNYEYINLSIGPELPIDDEEVHAWTAVLDDYLSNGHTLATIAAGNTGEIDSDDSVKAWRVQVPSDCVNALTVGASDRVGDDWSRAEYSSRGPGRSPGIVKPDLVTFGGCEQEPFWTLGSINGGQRLPKQGTSFAAPTALRCGIATRAHLGSVLSPLAIRALLIHCTNPKDHENWDVGWGRLPNTLSEVILCPEDSVRVVYQDEISPAKFRRIFIPLPSNGLSGRVTLTATFCYATEIDPGHPRNYTRSGLSIVFRPHRRKFSGPGAIHPKPESFFQPRNLYPTEHELRMDAHKWETCLHRKKTKRASSLFEPLFDIHHQARVESHASENSSRIRYALVLTIHAPEVEGFYDQIVSEYRNRLQPLTPAIDVPVNV